MKNHERFAYNLTKLLFATETTQRELARATGVAVATISRWVNAESIPNIYHAEKIADYFDLTLDELLN